MRNDEGRLHGGRGAVRCTSHAPQAPHSGQESPWSPTASTNNGRGDLNEAAEIGRGWLSRVGWVKGARPHVCVEADGSEAGGCPHGEGGVAPAFHGAQRLFPACQAGSVSRCGVPGARVEGEGSCIGPDVKRGAA
eukprot:2393338-Heterocapsa_arctica.AAC.1